MAALQGETVEGFPEPAHKSSLPLHSWGSTIRGSRSLKRKLEQCCRSFHRGTFLNKRAMLAEEMTSFERVPVVIGSPSAVAVTLFI